MCRESQVIANVKRVGECFRSQTLIDTNSHTQSITNPIHSIVHTRISCHVYSIPSIKCLDCSTLSHAIPLPLNEWKRERDINNRNYTRTIENVRFIFDTIGISLRLSPLFLFCVYRPLFESGSCYGMFSQNSNSACFYFLRITASFKGKIHWNGI